MPRPSRDTDRRLLKTARAMLPATGLSGLRLRAVAKKAGVNLGMFHYHFRSKEAFARRLLQETYEEFFAKLSVESSGAGTPIERLRRALTVFGRFVRDNRQLIMVLIHEVLRGNKACAAFAKENIPRHAALVAGLIKEGQAAGEIKRIPLPMAMPFAMGGMGVPNVVVSMVERAGAKRPMGMTLPELAETLLSDRAIEQRVDLILSALAAPRTGGKR